MNRNHPTPSRIITILSLVAILGICAFAETGPRKAMTGDQLSRAIESMKDTEFKTLIAPEIQEAFTSLEEKLPLLDPDELAEALQRMRSTKGKVTGEISIDLARLSKNARFDPETGTLFNGKSIINIYELPDEIDVRASPDGSFVVEGLRLSGTLERVKTDDSSNNIFKVRGSIAGITPSPESTFTIDPTYQLEDSEGKTYTNSIPFFLAGSKITSIDPESNTLFGTRGGGPVRDKGAVILTGVELPGGHLISNGFLLAQDGQLHAPDLETNRPGMRNGHPVIDGIEIDAIGSHLPIHFNEQETSTRHVLITEDQVNVKGTGARAILREGNTIAPIVDYYEWKEGTKVPIDYAELFSNGGSVRIEAAADSEEPRATITGKAGISNGFWKFTSDGKDVHTTSIRSDMKDLAAYDAMDMKATFSLEDPATGSTSPYTISIIDNPKGAIDLYRDGRISANINAPARDATEARDRMISMMPRLAGAPVDFYDGYGLSNPKEQELFPGTQFACIDASCVAAQMAGSPYLSDPDLARQVFAQQANDLIANEKLSSKEKTDYITKHMIAYQSGEETLKAENIRRNRVIAPYLASKGLYRPLGIDDLTSSQFGNLYTDLPSEYLTKANVPSGTNGYRAKPGDVVFFNAYKSYNSEEGWTEYRGNIHSVMVASTTADGRIKEVWSAISYDPDRPGQGSQHFDTIRKFTFKEWLAQRKNGIAGKKLYIPAGIGTFPGMKEAGIEVSGETE